jgi:hypothetical protein
MPHLLVLLVCWMAAAPLTAQVRTDGPAVPEVDSGLRDYAEACARCHGMSGKGDGVLAEFLRVPAPDLTGIARANGGDFPSGLIFEIIEGGGSTSAHGSREMPAWGTRFAGGGGAEPGAADDPETEGAAVRARIEALVAFIATLQEP